MGALISNCTTPSVDVLVIGAPGSGKSTLVSAMVQTSTGSKSISTSPPPPANGHVVTTLIRYNGGVNITLREAPLKRRDAYADDMADVLLYVIDPMVGNSQWDGETIPDEVSAQLLDLFNFASSMVKNGNRERRLIVVLNKAKLWLEHEKKRLTEKSKAVDAAERRTRLSSTHTVGLVDESLKHYTPDSATDAEPYKIAIKRKMTDIGFGNKLAAFRGDVHVVWAFDEESGSGTEIILSLIVAVTADDSVMGGFF